MKRSTGPMRASVPASSTAIVQRLIDLIEKSYALRITLASLSKALRSGVRLAHAARYLRDGLKIEAVALSVGYKSKKNLYRQFIRRFDVTASQLCIAIVDDESVRDAAANLFRSMGLTAVAFSSAEDFLSTCRCRGWAGPTFSAGSR